MGLTSILHFELPKLPPVIQTNVLQIVQGCIKLIVQIDELKKELAKEEADKEKERQELQQRIQSDTWEDEKEHYLQVQQTCSSTLIINRHCKQSVNKTLVNKATNMFAI